MTSVEATLSSDCPTSQRNARRLTANDSQAQCEQFSFSSCPTACFAALAKCLMAPRFAEPAARSRGRRAPRRLASTPQRCAGVPVRAGRAADTALELLDPGGDRGLRPAQPGCRSLEAAEPDYPIERLERRDASDHPFSCWMDFISRRFVLRGVGVEPALPDIERGAAAYLLEQGSVWRKCPTALPRHLDRCDDQQGNGRSRRGSTPVQGIQPVHRLNALAQSDAGARIWTRAVRSTSSSPSRPTVACTRAALAPSAK